MKALDVASRVVGWLFIVLAAVLLLQPEGLLRKSFADWTYSRRVNAIARERWSELASSTSVVGSASANTQLVEFLDYRCAYCRMFGDTLSEFIVRHPEAVLIVRQAPRPGDRASRLAALAALCAADQGQFAQMNAVLLADTTWAREPNFIRAARRAGVKDIADFEQCQTSQRASRRLAADSAWVAVFGLSGTPVFISRAGGVHTGVVSSTVLSTWLN